MKQDANMMLEGLVDSMKTGKFNRQAIIRFILKQTLFGLIILFTAFVVFTLFGALSLPEFMGGNIVGETGLLVASGSLITNSIISMGVVAGLAYLTHTIFGEIKGFFKGMLANVILPVVISAAGLAAVSAALVTSSFGGSVIGLAITTNIFVKFCIDMNEEIIKIDIKRFKSETEKINFLKSKVNKASEGIDKLKTEYKKQM